MLDKHCCYGKNQSMLTKLKELFYKGLSKMFWALDSLHKTRGYKWFDLLFFPLFALLFFVLTLISHEMIHAWAFWLLLCVLNTLSSLETMKKRAKETEQE